MQESKNRHMLHDFQRHSQIFGLSKFITFSQQSHKNKKSKVVMRVRKKTYLRPYPCHNTRNKKCCPSKYRRNQTELFDQLTLLFASKI